MDGARVTGAAMRRQERRLCSWANHERLSIAMALAEKLHHSAQKVMEQHVFPREQEKASAGEGEEYEKNALYAAIGDRRLLSRGRGQRATLLCRRRASLASWRVTRWTWLLSISSLHQLFLVRKKEEKEDREEVAKAAEKEKRRVLLRNNKVQADLPLSPEVRAEWRRWIMTPDAVALLHSLAGGSSSCCSDGAKEEKEKEEEKDKKDEVSSWIQDPVVVTSNVATGAGAAALRPSFVDVAVPQVPVQIVEMIM